MALLQSYGWLSERGLSILIVFRETVKMVLEYFRLDPAHGFFSSTPEIGGTVNFMAAERVPSLTVQAKSAANTRGVGAKEREMERGS